MLIWKTKKKKKSEFKDDKYSHRKQGDGHLSNIAFPAFGERGANLNENEKPDTHLRRDTLLDMKITGISKIKHSDNYNAKINNINKVNCCVLIPF